MAEITWTPTKRLSSNVAEVGRDPEGHLYVRFHSGAAYRWDGAAESHHQALVDDASPGRYVARVLHGAVGKGQRIE